jgi:hypothetical protein
MLGSPEQESEILTQIMAFKDDPVGFVLYAYPWGQPGTPFADFDGPRPWQLEELERIGEHVRAQVFACDNTLPMDIFRGAWASGRGPGKSAFFAMLAHWHMSTRFGAPVIVTANTETQMRTKTFPEFSVWFGAAINAHWFTIENLRIIPAPWMLELVKKLPQEGGLGIDPKYWYCSGQTWSAENPDSFAGAHNPYGMMVLFDEASGIHPKVWDVTEGFFTEINPYRFFCAASQMRSRTGRFFEIVYDAVMGAGWYKRVLTTRGMPGIDQNVIKSQIARYGEESDFVRVEIDGLPPRTSEDQFISWDAVSVAQNNKLFQDFGEALVLGVDPAPRGKTAWRFRQGRNARDCCGPATHGSWQNFDNVQIADAVIRLDNRFMPDYICVDFGMGTGVIDILKRVRTNGRLIPVVFGASPVDKKGGFGSHAAELWGRLRDWLLGGMIEKDSGEKGSLSQQLTDRGWRWSGKEDGKKILETKEDLMKRGVASPDDADALACTLEVVNAPRKDRLASTKSRIVLGTDSWMGE